MELTELREVPPKIRSAPVVMGMISVSSGSERARRRELERARRGEHADDGDRDAVDVDGLAHRVARGEELRRGGRAEHADRACDR